MQLSVFIMHVETALKLAAITDPGEKTLQEWIALLNDRLGEPQFEMEFIDKTQNDMRLVMMNQNNGAGNGTPIEVEEPDPNEDTVPMPGGTAGADDPTIIEQPATEETEQVGEDLVIRG